MDRFERVNIEFHKMSAREKRQFVKMLKVGGFVAESAIEQLSPEYNRCMVKLMLQLVEVDENFIDKLAVLQYIIQHMHMDYRRYIMPEYGRVYPGCQRVIGSSEKNGFFAWYIIRTIDLLYGEMREHYTETKKHINEAGQLSSNAKEVINNLSPVEFIIYAIQNQMCIYCNSDKKSIAEFMFGCEKFIDAVNNNLSRLVYEKLPFAENNGGCNTGIVKEV